MLLSLMADFFLLLAEDVEAAEDAFLANLSSKQKRKLMKKLQKESRGDWSSSDSDSASDVSLSRRHRSKKKKSRASTNANTNANTAREEDPKVGWREAKSPGTRLDVETHRCHLNMAVKVIGAHAHGLMEGTASTKALGRDETKTTDVQVTAEDQAVNGKEASFVPELLRLDVLRDWNASS